MALAPASPPAAEPRPLTALQQRFVQEYRLDGRAAAAARRAGYAPASARWSGYQLTRDPRVRRLLDVDPDNRHPEDTAVEELEKLAYSNLLDVAVVRPDGALEVDLARLERGRAAAVREVTIVEKTAADGATTRITRLKLVDKSLALARLLRIYSREDRAEDKGRTAMADQIATMPVENLARFRAYRRSELNLPPEGR